MAQVADKTEQLFEYADNRNSAMKVDRERGVVKGVKVLGFESLNGRTYTKSAVKEAISMYEGARINVNHPAGATNAPRNYQDRFGALRNVRYEESTGLHGDVYYNPKHALAEQFAWDAEHAPENVGLSHNVQARTRRDGNKLIIEGIVQVVSVDLVADPATNKTLYEGISNTATLQQVIEALDEEDATILQSLIESGMAVPESPMSGEGDPLDAAFNSILTALATDKSLSTKEKLSKLKEMFMAQEKVTPKNSELPEGETKESLQAKLSELATLKEAKAAQDAANAVLAEAKTLGVTLTDVQVKAACNLTEAVDRKAFIESLKPTPAGARSAAPKAFTEAKSSDSAVTESREDYIKRMRRG